jgi:phosphonate transport system ATP-binding protein
VRREERWLFRNLAFDIRAGEVLAVLGPSGVGKSTLLACLSGAMDFTEGKLAAPEHFAEQPAAVVFQDLRLVPQASLLGNVLMARLGRHRWWETLWSFPAHECRAAGRELEALGLSPLMHRRVCEVSGGEQQRTALARALFAEAPLLLADEPVANLDEPLARRVLERMRHYALKANAAVVCVLHHEEQAMAYADAFLRLDPEQPEGWIHEANSFIMAS